MRLQARALQSMQIFVKPRKVSQQYFPFTQPINDKKGREKKRKNKKRRKKDNNLPVGNRTFKHGPRRGRASIVFVHVIPHLSKRSCKINNIAVQFFLLQILFSRYRDPSEVKKKKNIHYLNKQQERRKKFLCHVLLLRSSFGRRVNQELASFNLDT